MKKTKSGLFIPDNDTFKDLLEILKDAALIQETMVDLQTGNSDSPKRKAAMSNIETIKKIVEELDPDKIDENAIKKFTNALLGDPSSRDGEGEVAFVEFRRDDKGNQVYVSLDQVVEDLRERGIIE